MSAQTGFGKSASESIRELLAQCREAADRKQWFHIHFTDLMWLLCDLAEEDVHTYNVLLTELCDLVPDMTDYIKETIKRRQQQNEQDERNQERNEDFAKGSARHKEINRLQQAVIDVIDKELKSLPTYEECWQYILDHPKAIITPLAKLWVIDQSASEAVIEKLSPLLHRKDTRLREMIKAEAKLLRQQDYGRDFDTTKDGLQRSESGALQSNFYNAQVLLREHLTSKVIGWDLFHNKIMWKLRPIWETKETEPAMPIAEDATGLGYRAIHETDLTRATVWLNQQGLQRIAYDTVRRVIRSFAYQHQFNSLHDYLARYRGIWDKVDRLSVEFDLVHKLFGTKYKDAKEKELCNMMWRKQLIGWMQRSLYPGCKFRTMLHLIGDQRVGKSRLLEVLAGPYYVAYRHKRNDPSHSDSYTQMIGFTLGELGESSQLRTWDYEIMKDSLSTTRDNVRKPYAEDFVLLARSWVLFGTSNNELEFLPDPTGNSRHFIIKVDWNFDKGEEIPIEWFETEIRTQLLAQLIYLVEVAEEDSWLDHDQSLAHKEYVSEFEMTNTAGYVIERALERITQPYLCKNNDGGYRIKAKESGGGYERYTEIEKQKSEKYENRTFSFESVFAHPGFRFEELYAMLNDGRRKPLSRNDVARTLSENFGMESEKIANHNVKIGEKRQTRWFLKGTWRKLSDEAMLAAINARTDIFVPEGN